MKEALSVKAIAPKATAVIGVSILVLAAGCQRASKVEQAFNTCVDEAAQEVIDRESAQFDRIDDPSKQEELAALREELVAISREQARDICSVLKRSCDRDINDRSCQVLLNGVKN